MADSSKRVFNVAVLVFTGADILDVAGPLEVLSNTIYNMDLEHPEWAFSPVVIASDTTATAGRCMTVQASMTITDAIAKINDFDILIVPGGNPGPILEKCAKGCPELDLVKAFNDNPAADDEKIILSVCTGALFLGSAGILSGLKATTHHMFLDGLRGLDKTIDVISPVNEEGKPSRYVDGGVNKQGKRIITAGGVTCGLDATLAMVEMKAGEQVAAFTTKMLEYTRTKA